MCEHREWTSVKLLLLPLLQLLQGHLTLGLVDEAHGGRGCMSVPSSRLALNTIFRAVLNV